MPLPLLPFRPPSPLRQQIIPPLRQYFHLSALDPGQPISETSSRGGEEGPRPKGFFVEEGTHFDAELPEADCEACSDWWWLVLDLICWEGLGRGLRTEAAPEEDFVDHCELWVENRVVETENRRLRSAGSTVVDCNRSRRRVLF